MSEYENRGTTEATEWCSYNAPGNQWAKPAMANFPEYLKSLSYPNINSRVRNMDLLLFATMAHNQKHAQCVMKIMLMVTKLLEKLI